MCDVCINVCVLGMGDKTIIMINFKEVIVSAMHTIIISPMTFILDRC